MHTKVLFPAIVYFAVVNLILAFIVTGLVDFKAVMTWLVYPTYFEFVIFCKTALASGLLVTAIILLAQPDKLTQAYYTIPAKFTLSLLLVMVSVLIIGYLPHWSIVVIGDNNYWQMIYGGTLVYYTNSGYLIGILVLLGLAKGYFYLFAARGQATCYPSSHYAPLIAFGLWLVGLDLYHSNELLTKLSVSTAVSMAIDSQLILTLLYLLANLVYVGIKIAVAFLFKERLRQNPHYLLTLGVIIWLLPLMMSETFSLLFDQMGTMAVGFLFYGTEFIVTWLICYVCFKKW